ncbi:MAG: hypothetical protein JW830_13100 [Bacteroidales bacterium]|nr:hypothetical protein [Bacteroidales bacterium]
MKGKTVLKILLGIIVLALFIRIITTVWGEPWVRKKIQTALNEGSKDYAAEIEKVKIFILAAGIKLEGIRISSKQDSDKNVLGEIVTLKIKGINLPKAVFKKEIVIREVTIFDCNIEAKIPFPEDSVTAMLSPRNIRIDKTVFDKTNLAIENTANAQAFSMKEGVCTVYDVRVEKQDTISSGIFRQFDFEAKELFMVSPDSMYSYKATGIAYSATLNNLEVIGFSVQPNYTNYNFTARNTFETTRIEAVFSHVSFHDFPAMTFLKSGSLISSYIKIGKMNLNAFRDKRKEFKHVDKPEFQDLIYNYPGTIRIDSLVMMKGNVTYTVHGELANDPGNISFNEIHAKIYKITNDSVYKTDKGFLELTGETLLMGKGRMTVELKAEIFDNHNTFSLNGTLSNLEAKELNPILEKNAFVYATSGKIDAMHFSFMANDVKATGKMTLLYHGLDLAVKNKRTDDTTAIKERIISFIANRKVMDSNPIPGKDVREGIIDYDRDPERFLFNYCFKSVLSGIQSTLAKSPD